MTGLSTVNKESKSWSDSPWGCSVLGCSLNRVNYVDESDFKVRELLAQ